MDEQTGEKTQNMLVDRLFQCRISPWPKTAEKRGFCAGVTDGRTDRPSYRNAFLTDASKKNKCIPWMVLITPFVSVT